MVFAKKIQIKAENDSVQGFYLHVDIHSMGQQV